MQKRIIKENLLIIPARLKSKRLKEKLLRKVNGKTILEHTYNNAIKTKNTNVIVATDSKKIKNHIDSLGGTSIITPSDISSGTERVLFVAKNYNSKYIINLQADEPMLLPEDIEKSFELLKTSDSKVSTLCFKNYSYSDFCDENIVKIVLDCDNNALYFSRSAIPYQNKKNFNFFYNHIGIYAFKRSFFINDFPFLKSKLEKQENLEQLKFLENNIKIKVGIVDKKTVGVDTSNDLKIFKQIIGGKCD